MIEGLGDIADDVYQREEERRLDHAEAEGRRNASACEACGLVLEHRPGELGTTPPDDDWKIHVFEASVTVDSAEEALVHAVEKLESAKELVKARRKDFDDAVCELRDEIKGKGQGRLPFPDSATETAGGVTVDATPPPPRSRTGQ